MLRYTLHRLLIMIPTLLVISFITFMIIKLPPGDFLSNQIAELKSQGDNAALEKVDFLRKQYGLDKPFLEQYAVWVGLWPGDGKFHGLLQGVEIPVEPDRFALEALQPCVQLERGIGRSTDRCGERHTHSRHARTQRRRSRPQAA